MDTETSRSEGAYSFDGRPAPRTLDSAETLVLHTQQVLIGELVQVKLRGMSWNVQRLGSLIAPTGRFWERT